MLVVLLPLFGLLVTTSGHPGGRHESSEEEGGEGRGICLNGMEIAALCVQKTDFGKKMATAVAACMAAPPTAGRRAELRVGLPPLPPLGGKSTVLMKITQIF